MAGQWPEVEHCCGAHDDDYEKGGGARLKLIVDVEFLH
jgi:hypothetical protein